MIRPQDLLAALSDAGVESFVGVPDSLLAPFLSHLAGVVPDDRHLIAANEGAAVGLAIGHHLRTGEVPLVYLQNSGLGNAVNPLLSLASPEVYGIPMVLLIGWRGEPGRPDEPQHITQGRILTAMLDAMEIPWSVLPDRAPDLADAVRTAVRTALVGRTPHALLVRRGTLADDRGTTGRPGYPRDPSAGEAPTREDALREVIDAAGGRTVLVATTGMLGRELFELRARRGESGARDLLTVGGMGHANAIALGIARAAPDDDVWVLDGDGALLMHLGALPVIASSGPRRFLHVLFDNGVHDSVGGQPTPLRRTDWVDLARAAGYPAVERAQGGRTIQPALARLGAAEGPGFLHLPVRPGHRSDLGRPTGSPAAWRERFTTAVRGPASG